MPLGRVRLARDGWSMGNVIAFMPASGGVGATSVAATVAVRATAAGRSAVAVDLDRLAGRLDVTFGVEQSPGWRWTDLAGVDGVVDGVGLGVELPVACGVPVLSQSGSAGWRPPDDHSSDPWLDVVADVVIGLSEAHELTVLDLSRDVAVLGAVGRLVDAVVVVVGTQVEQLAAATVVVPGVRRVLAQTRAVGFDVHMEPLLPIEPWVVLRGRRVEPVLEDLVMDELDVPLAGVIGDDPGLVADVVDGLPPGARGRGEVVRVADDLLLRLMRQEVAA